MDRDASAILKPTNDAVIPGPNGKQDILKKLVDSNTGDGTIISQLLQNPFFTAGFGLAGLGAVVRYGTVALRRGAALLKHRMLVNLEITRHDDSYPWVLNWMTAQYRAQVAPSTTSVSLGITERLIRRFTPGLHHLQIHTATRRSANGAENTAFALVPGHGKHILRYKNAFLAVNRERVGKSFDAQGQPFETITLTTLYYYRNIFEDIFHEAHAMAARQTEGKTIVYTSQNVGWDPLGQPKRRRPFDSVVLEDGVAAKILDDVREFLDARTWYLDRGIPYRRGYLLYGPPGTGKTSFVQALAGELGFNIAMLSLSQRGLHDDLLNKLLLTVPPRTLVLLEDADAAFSNRRQVEADGYSGANVTYSGLLNALDGVASAEERIVFMTTNHIDRLDEALVRPGRVDMTIRLGNATEDQIARLWDRFYAAQDPDGSHKKRFVELVREREAAGTLSTAALQGLFLYNKSNPQGAINTFPDLMASISSHKEARNQKS